MRPNPTVKEIWPYEGNDVSSPPVQQRILHGLMSILLAGCPTAFAAEESISTDDYWKLSAQEKNVVIYSRPRPGSPLKEFKAVGPIDAPTGAVCAVIDDFQNFARVMAARARWRNKNSCHLFHLYRLGWFYPLFPGQSH